MTHDPQNSDPSSAELNEYLEALLALPPVQPWPQPVDGAKLLEEIRRTICRFVVLPRYAPETFALWVPHTYAFSYRDITTYLGIESPEHRCGKSTLISVLVVGTETDPGHFPVGNPLPGDGEGILELGQVLGMNFCTLGHGTALAFGKRLVVEFHKRG